MKTKASIFAGVFLGTCLIGAHCTNAAITLIQTFSEQNIVGSSGLGMSVSGAGDVNGDSYDDVIVGAYR